MPNSAVQQQIIAIREVTKEATKSKAAAVKFLKDAGIYSGKPKSSSKGNVSKKK